MVVTDKNEFTIDTTYNYHGIKCTVAKFKVTEGAIEVYTDYGEKMFSGTASELPEFITKLGRMFYKK